MSGTKTVHRSLKEAGGSQGNYLNDYTDMLRHLMINF